MRNKGRLMKKKKILFYCDSMDNGGTEKATLDLVNNLSKDKYEITIIQLSHGGKYQKMLNGYIHNREIIPFDTYKHFRYYWWARRLYEKIPVALVHRFIIGNKFDIEIACGYSYPTKIVSKSKSAKKIAWIHMDVELDKGVVPEMSREEGKQYFSNIDKFVCVSYDCAKKFNDKFGFKDKTEVCYNVLSSKDIIEKSNYAPEVKFDKNTINIVAIGRLTWQKGFDILIRSAGKIIEKNRNVKLYIMGEGEDREQLEKQIEENEMRENIQLLGHVDNPYPILKQADFYVCSSRHESFSLTVAESIILAVPVVSTKCTGPIELLDDGKYGIMCECEENSLCTAIEKMLDEKTRSQYKEKTKERKEFFNIENTIAVWEGVLDEK